MWTGRLWKQPACWLYIPLFSECLKIWSAFGWEIEKWKIPVLTWPPILKGSQNHEMNIAGWFSVFKELQLTNIPQPSIPQTACKDPHVEYFVLSPSQPPCYLWFWLLSVTKSASRGTVPTGYINILPVTKDCKHMKLTYQTLRPLLIPLALCLGLCFPFVASATNTFLDTTLVCNNLVQVSLDQNCEALIEPDDILEGYNGNCWWSWPG